MTEEPDIECTKCGTMVNWLAVFPGDICLDCHAQKTSTLTADELLDRLAEHGLVGSASKLREFAQML